SGDGAVCAINRVLGRHAYLPDCFQGPIVFFRCSLALIVVLRRRISADYQQVSTGRKALVPRSVGEDSNVSRLKLDDLAVIAAEPHAGLSACDTEYLVGSRMIMHVIVDAVAPRTLPTICFEQPLE